MSGFHLHVRFRHTHNIMFIFPIKAHIVPYKRIEFNLLTLSVTVFMATLYSLLSIWHCAHSYRVQFTMLPEKAQRTSVTFIFQYVNTEGRHWLRLCTSYCCHKAKCTVCAYMSQPPIIRRGTLLFSFAYNGKCTFLCACLSLQKALSAK